jgi:hypothetical protein
MFIGVQGPAAICPLPGAYSSGAQIIAKVAAVFPDNN